MSDARRARAGNERLAQCLDGVGFGGFEQAERHALGAGLPWGQQQLRAADRERERADGRAAHEVSSFHLVHDVLPNKACPSASSTKSRRRPEELLRTILLGVLAATMRGAESSRVT